MDETDVLEQEDEATVTDIATGETVDMGDWVDVEYVPVGESLLMDAEKSYLPIKEGISFELWLSSADSVIAAAKGSQWWVGDWAVYGEDHWNEKHAQAFDPATMDIDQLNQWKWVARGYPDPEDRFDDLSWTHHRIALKLRSKPSRRKHLQWAVDNGPVSTREFSKIIDDLVDDGSEDQSDQSKANEKIETHVTIETRFTVEIDQEERGIEIAQHSEGLLRRRLGKANLHPTSMGTTFVRKTQTQAEKEDRVWLDE